MSLDLNLAGTLRLTVEHRGNIQVAAYTLAKLQQAKSLHLPPLVVSFTREGPKSFTLPYTLTADDINPIERELQIVVEVVEPREPFPYPTFPAGG